MEYRIEAADAPEDLRSVPGSVSIDIFRTLADQSSDLLFAIAAPENRFLYINKNVSDIIGYSDAEAMAIAPQAMMTASSAGELCGAIRKAIAGNSAGHQRVEVPLQHIELLAKNRKRIAAELRLTLSLRNDQTVAVITGIVKSDAVWLKTREEARRSEERHRALLEGIPDAILRIGIDGKVTYCKPDAGNLLIKAADVAGFDLFALPLPETVKAQLREHIRRVLSGENLPPDEIELPIGDRKRIGEIRMFRETAESAVLFIRDSTDRRRTEMELIKTQRLESIGLLAGGIAHDFNNLLGLIFGQIDMALEGMDPFGEPARRLQNSMRAFERARDLTGQLCTLSKEKVPVKQPVNIFTLVHDAAILSLSGSNVAFSISAPDENLFVESDPGQMSQAVNNLLINARQAMEHGGTVTIALREATPADLPKTASSGRYVAVSVQDGGHGIPPEQLHAIFDPFFTTKENGSGLGLTMVHSIITRHGGMVSVDSTPGVGTRFTLLLPMSCVDAKLVAAPPVESHPQLLQGKILIMDDEEVLLDIADQMCRRLGLETGTAMHGAAAIELYRTAFREGCPYDAVLLDMTIAGGTGGVDAAAIIRKIDPEAKCIVMSGYSDHEVMADPEKYGFCAMVSKPFRLNEFGKVLATVLGC